LEKGLISVGISKTLEDKSILLISNIFFTIFFGSKSFIGEEEEAEEEEEEEEEAEEEEEEAEEEEEEADSKFSLV
jgi:hypothetical protein